MIWQQTPYITSMLLLSVSLIPLGLYVWWRYRGLEAAVGTLLVLASAEWLLVSVIQLAAVDLPTKLFWNQIKYIGAVTAPTLWLIFALVYTHREKWVNRSTLALLSIVPGTTLVLVFTSQYHHLIWENVSIVSEGPFLILHHEYGSWFFINVLYSYGFILVSSFLLIKMFFHHRHLFRWQSSMLLLGALIPLFWNVLDLFRFNPFPFLESVPFVSPFANFAAVYLILEARMQDIVPVARDIVIDTMSDSIIVLDAQNRVIDVNTAAQQLMGSPSSVIGRPIEEVFPSWSSEIEGTNGMSDREIELDLSNVNLSSTDRRIYDLRTSTVRSWRGDIVSRVIVVRDITERKMAEELIRQQLKEKEILLREIHHRVKNNLQIISSLLRLQSRYMKNAHDLDMIKESQNRIKSMALIHEKLYQSENMAHIYAQDYVKDLVYGLVQSYSVANDIGLTMDVGDVLLGVDAAIPCGLIINELVSNCLKHAFPNGKGEITVSLHATGGNIEVVVSDNGVGIPDDIDIRNTDSLGLRLVTILAEDQLQGTVELNRDRGTEFRIIFSEVKK